jgi:hypothetical protein
MQSKHSAVLVGQLTLLAMACLITAFALILMEGGQWSYHCGVWFRAWVNRYRNRTIVKGSSLIIASESLSPIVPELGRDFEPAPDPWELPLKPLPAPRQLLLKAPTKSVLYLLPPARDPQYTAMTVRELKRIARDRQIPNYGRMNKTQLIQSLQAA